MNDVSVEPGVHQLPVGDRAIRSRHEICLCVAVSVDDFSPELSPPIQIYLLAERFGTYNLGECIEDLVVVDRFAAQNQRTDSAGQRL